METPTTTHITQQDYESIYEPAEDSFLLLDAIESDLKFIENLKPTLCLEIGSGSGIIITALAKKLGNQAFCLTTDINYKACLITKKTASCNYTTIDAVNMNLFDCLHNNSCIDLLIFNPPYVLTNHDDEFQIFQNSDIIKSWSGGIDGCIITNKVIENLKNILSLKGVFYLLLLKENKPNEIMEKLKDEFNAIILMQRRIPGEHLFILKITRKSNDKI